MRVVQWIKQSARLGLTPFEYRHFRSLFDVSFYTLTQPDVADAGVDPEYHYVRHGWLEARNPSERFDTIWYLHMYSDALDSGLNPLVHFAKYGRLDFRKTVPKFESTSPWRSEASKNPAIPQLIRRYLDDYITIERSGLFDYNYYNSNADLTGGDSIEHFLRYGVQLRLDPNPTFSCENYLRLHLDVRQAGINPLVHYIKHGIREKRLSKSILRHENAFNVEFAGAANDEQNEEFTSRVSFIAGRGPLISVVVPTYNTDVALLKACIGSIANGIYDNIEIIIVDDASTKKETIDYITMLQLDGLDIKCRVIIRGQNGNISCATNDGVSMANGEFVAFVDHDDELFPDSLLTIAEAIVGNSAMDVWYSDQIKCDINGRPTEHFYKPDWSPIYLLGAMYIGHLLVARTSLVRQLNGFLSEFDGVQDFEFMLRLSSRTNKIGHIPRVLYKWRSIPGSLAAGVEEKSGIVEKQQVAVQGHLLRQGFSWIASIHPTLPHRLTMCASNATNCPTISIVIPSKDLGYIVEKCLDSIFSLTDYPNYEVIIVDNGTTDTVALAAFERHCVRTIRYDGKFNFSQACNLGASIAQSDYLVFLNNDTEIIDSRWLRDQVLFFEDPGVGAVGPVLLYPDRTVQHAGIVLGARGTADHVMRFFPENVDGYAGSLACAREVSGVTAACIMMPAAIFREVGMFSTDYSKHYQDIDLCLKIIDCGKRIICAAGVKLIHHESVTRKSEGYDFGDRAILVDRWSEIIHGGDRYYNKNLSLELLDYSLYKRP